MVFVFITLFCLFPSMTSIEDTQYTPIKIVESPQIREIEPSRGEPKGDIKLLVEATGYTKHDEGLDGRGITASGTIAEPGVIAADPAVIPLGSKVIIPGYGIATVEDTGGAIKGNKIDLCFATQEEAYEWGRKIVTITILSREPS